MAIPISIREATLADLDAMVDVYLAAFPEDPVWSYIFPNYPEYPEETRNLTLLEFAEYLENKHEKLRFIVAEVPKMEDESVMVVAAICLWKFAVGPEARLDEEAGKETSKEDDPFENRRDGDTTRIHMYNAAVAKAERTYHDEPYGERQIRLKLLATHPDYQRQGIASKLVTWGMCLATEQHKFLTVMAGPRGKQLYKRLGFYEQASMEIKVDGEVESATFTAMICNAF